MTSTSRFTTTPVPPTSAKRTNCRALRLCRRIASDRVVLTLADPIQGRPARCPQPRRPGPGVRPPAGSVRLMTSLRFRGPVLPDGEARDLYVVEGRVTLE